MTELEEKLLAGVTKLEDGMSALSEQLRAINRRLDASAKFMQTVQSDLTKYSEAQQKLSPILQKLQAHFTE